MEVEFFKEMGELFAGMLIVVAPLTVRWVKKRYEKVNFTKQKIDISLKVNDLLVELRQKYGVDRLGVLEFSNGDESVNGFPFLYVTMTYEKCKINVSSIKAEVNKVPASWFIHFNSFFTDNTDNRYGCFFENGQVYIGDKSTPHYSADVANDLKAYGVQTNYTFKIGRNINAGLVNLAFLNTYKQFSPEEISDIQAYVSQLSKLFKQRPK